MFGFDDIIAAAPLISSAGSFLGNILGNNANQDIAQNANVASAEQAQLNREFQASQADRAMQYQTEMSNTSYQRSVRDMQAAGLNPMLAYMKGGASTPSGFAGSGSQAAVIAPNYQSPVASAASALNAGLDSAGRYRSNVASANQAEASVGQIEANTEKIREEIKNIPLEGDRIKRAAHLLFEQSNLASQQQLTESQRWAQVAETVNNLKKDGTLKQLDINAANALDNLGRTSKELKPIVDILRVFLRK